MRNFCLGACVYLAAAAAACAQGLPAPPGFTPSPRLAVTPDLAQLPAGSVAQKFALYRGWNAVAFPFAHVDGVSGFPYGLHTSFGEPLDVQALTPGIACWAYSDADGEAQAWGVPLAQPLTLPLSTGWNFIGSPYLEGVDAAQSTLSQSHNLGQRSLNESVGPWLQSEAFEIRGIKPMGFDLAKANVRLQPGRAYLLQASTNVQMQLAPPGASPQVTAVNLGAPGELVVSGSRFGPPGAGRLLLDGQGVVPNDVIAWGPDQIRVRWAGNIQPKVAQVMTAPANLAQSPAPGLQSADRLSAPKAALRPFACELRVVNEAEEPVPNARIEVNHQLVARTDSSGWARWNAGSASIVYARVVTQWFQSKDVKLTASAGRHYSGHTVVYSDRTTIDLKLMCCSGNYRPVKVDVWRKNDQTQHQLQTWTWDQATPYVSYFYYDLPVGLTYHFEFTWRNPQGIEKLLTFDKKLRPQGIRDTIPNYWNSNPWSY